jgi:hypothetical protein
MSTFGEDIMCTAVEGGIGYFAVITDAKRTPDLDWVEVTIEDAEGDDAFEPMTVKATAMEKAAREMIADDCIRQALKERDAGYIDSYDAQAVFQQAAFGEQVFG